MSVHKAITSFQAEYGFLSNFAPCFSLAGGSVEISYQAAKFAFDPEAMERIIGADTPGKATQLATKLTHLVRPDWLRVREQVMWMLLCQKFDPYFEQELVEKLLATKDAQLIEGNTWHDTHWGMCCCATCNNQGKNILGLMLMERRDQLCGIINE